jgi:hypothetical protein
MNEGLYPVLVPLRSFFYNITAVRLRTVLLALLPGAAHVDLGKARTGLIYFSLFALSVNAALVAPLLTAGRTARLACALAAAGLWIAALYGAVRTAARQG